jgi:hypothetical protein
VAPFAPPPREPLDPLRLGRGRSEDRDESSTVPFEQIVQSAVKRL